MFLSQQKSANEFLCYFSEALACEHVRNICARDEDNDLNDPRNIKCIYARNWTRLLQSLSDMQCIHMQIGYCCCCGSLKLIRTLDLWQHVPNSIWSGPQPTLKEGRGSIRTPRIVLFTYQNCAPELPTGIFSVITVYVSSCRKPLGFQCVAALLLSRSRALLFGSFNLLFWQQLYFWFELI